MVAMLVLYGWTLEADGGGDAPRRLLERQVAAGLPFAMGGGNRLFDPAEAVNHVIAAGLAGAEPDWHDCFVETARRLARTVDPAAPAGGPVAARDYRVRFTRRFDLRRHEGRARLRLPRPVADDLMLVFDSDVAGVAVEGPGRIAWSIAPPAPPSATISFDAGFTSRLRLPDTRLPDPAQRDRWRAPAEGLVQVTPTVRALAAQLAEGAHDDQAVLAALYGHLIDGFSCGVIAYEAIAGAATDHVLSTRWYDCQLGAALLVALCRARGMMARLVGGYLLAPAAPTPHYWCEVWLDGDGDAGPGWRPYDLLGWDLSAGGGDAGWRGVFAGRIDHRMTTQVFPDVFTGMTVPALPIAHHRIARRAEGGVTIDHVGLDGRPVYRDRIAVTPA